MTSGIWFEIARQNRDRYLVAFDRLNRTIELAARRAARKIG